eukprot:202702_1
MTHSKKNGASAAPKSSPDIFTTSSENSIPCGSVSPNTHSSDSRAVATCQPPKSTVTIETVNLQKSGPPLTSPLPSPTEGGEWIAEESPPCLSRSASPRFFESEPIEHGELREICEIDLVGEPLRPDRRDKPDEPVSDSMSEASVKSTGIVSKGIPRIKVPTARRPLRKFVSTPTGSSSVSPHSHMSTTTTLGSNSVPAALPNSAPSVIPTAVITAVPSSILRAISSKNGVSMRMAHQKTGFNSGSTAVSTDVSSAASIYDPSDVRTATSSAVPSTLPTAVAIASSIALPAALSTAIP